MGAGRARILRQLLMESLLLAMTGGLAGVSVASGGMWRLLRLAGNTIPNVGAVGIDYRVLLFAVATVVVAGILFGFAPALQISKLDLRSALNEASRGSTGGAGQRRMQSILVIAEIAVALVLLVGAGLLLRSFQQLRKCRPALRRRIC